MKLNVTFVLFILFNFSGEKSTEDKINGVNLVSPMDKALENCLQPVCKLNANWISLCPWAYMTPGDPNIYFKTIENYWGDHPENMVEIIKEAKNQNLQILLKPHFWVTSQGWPGDFDLNETGWYVWEKNYANFVLELAHFAEEQKIDMYCIGVEFKTSIQKRPGFWKNLIQEVRQIYSGKLIYAANWDNYYNISFWDQLDYIGIDAYFPLVSEKTPQKEKLIKKWNHMENSLERISKKYNKKIIFTEFGYRSIDKTAWRQWEIESLSNSSNINLVAQNNSYEALFESLWNKEWFAGGFLWKWYIDNEEAGGYQHSGYTPQNKPVEKIIKKWYAN